MLMRAATRTNSLKSTVLWLLKNRQIQFLAGGGLIALIGMFLLYMEVHHYHLNANLAFFVQLVVTLAMNFAWNQFVTWRDVDCDRLGLLKRMGHFIWTRISSQALCMVLFWILTLKYIGMHYMAATVVCTLVVMLINYITSNKIVFTARRLVTEKG